eukprot:PhM_4_TR18420/c5_g3_i1/m.85181
MPPIASGPRQCPPAGPCGGGPQRRRGACGARRVRWPPWYLLRDLIPREWESAVELIAVRCGVSVAVCGYPRVSVSAADPVALSAPGADSVAARPLHDPTTGTLVKAGVGEERPEGLGPSLVAAAHVRPQPVSRVSDPGAARRALQIASGGWGAVLLDIGIAAATTSCTVLVPNQNHSNYVNKHMQAPLVDIIRQQLASQERTDSLVQ